MKKHSFFLLIFFLALGYAVFFFGRAMYRSLYFACYTPCRYTESAEELDNPYRGWYTIQGYLISDNASFHLPQAQDFSITGSLPGLVLLEINLKNYANCDLTTAALSQIDSILCAWADAGYQLILRFLYDWDGCNLLTEPKERSRILMHMEQTAPIVNRYASSVYLMQGIFAGNWGEMNNTIHMADDGLAQLITRLSELTDPSIFLSVRTPVQLRSILGSSAPLNGSKPFSGTLSARIGLFNDGMLGSESDTGTYGGTSASAAGYASAWTRADEISFQKQLCRSVPNGGEVIIDNSFNDFENAVRDLSLMHVSYLNSVYDPAVLHKWKQSFYHDSANTCTDVFEGMNGYDYIGRHLGYRYVIRSSSLSFVPIWNKKAALSVSIENVGFSVCYRPLFVSIWIVPEAGGESVCVDVDADMRLLGSGETARIKASLDVHALLPDSYKIFLSCQDPALDRMIEFANLRSDESFSEDYGYYLGTLVIS